MESYPVCLGARQKLLRAGNKCSYQNCGKSRRTHLQLHMFQFPVKDKERCKQWVFNSGIELSELKKPDHLKHRRICQDHFDISAFRNELKLRLNSTAVPLPCADSINKGGIILPLEQIFVVCEPLETNLSHTTLNDEEPLVLNRTKHTKTY